MRRSVSRSRLKADRLAADIDPGAADQGGWKVRFEGLATSWLDLPGQLALSARLRALEFVDDSGDALSVSLAVEQRKARSVAGSSPVCQR